MHSPPSGRQGDSSVPELSPSPVAGLPRSARAIALITAYVALTAGIFLCSGLMLLENGIESEVLLSAGLAISGATAFTIIGTCCRWRSTRPLSRPARADLTLWWVALDTSAVSVSVVSNRMEASAVVLLVSSAFAEELVFRRLPAECQLRTGLSGWGPTLVFAGATTVVFVLSHGGTSVLPTVEKLVFGGCAYLVCLRTRSVLLPSALHVLGNASASVWVSHSGSSAGGWFSIVSIGVSLLALWCATKPRSDEVSESHLTIFGTR
jgi:membrane protease YdiL (CAAX protease family)